MGFIHETGSDILSVETRGESMIVSDKDSKEQHIFVPQLRKKSVLAELAVKLERMAGSAFANRKREKAEELMRFSDLLNTITLEEPSEVRSFEVSYEWVVTFIDYCTGNEKVNKYLEQAWAKMKNDG